MPNQKPADLGLLILRLSIGPMLFVGHAMVKLSQIGTNAAGNFIPVLGLTPELSHFFAAMFEGVGAILIILGLFTRLSAFALTVFMSVAAFIATANSSFYPQWLPSSISEYKTLMTPFKEYPLLYCSVFLSLTFSGAGKFSIDNKIKYRLPYFLKFFCS
jgi:putative oxidoreductase